MADSLQLLAKRKKFGRGILRPFLNEDGIVKEASLLSLPAVDPVFDGRLMKARFTISTPGEDRSEDIVPPGCIDLKHYSTNPIVMYDHGMGSIDRPIGKSFDDEGERLAITVGKSGYEADCYFSESYPEAVQIAGMVDEGVLKAASIHISNIQAEQRSRGNGNRPGLLIKSAELLEWSIVGIPDNPEAVRKLLSRGTLAGEPICEAIKDMLKAHAPAKPAIGKGYRFTPVPDELLKMAEEEPAEDATPAEEPLGAQVIAGLHSAVKSLSEQLVAAMAMVENEKVVAGLKDLSKSLADLLATCEGLHQEAYPKSSAITGDEPEDQQAIETGAKALVQLGAGSRYRTKGILYRAEQLALAKNLLPTQRRTVETISELLAEALARASEPVVDVTKAAKPDPLAEALVAAGPSLKAFADEMRAIREAIEDARPQG